MAELRFKEIHPGDYEAFSRQVNFLKKYEKPLKTRIRWDRIKLLIFDCDGVMTDGRIIYGNEGQELKNFCAQDGMGFMLLQHTDITVAVITGRESEALTRRCKDLKIQYVYQKISNKLEQTKELLAELKLDFDNVLFMGDDWNDIPTMCHAAVAVAPANVQRDVAVYADYIMVSSGGHGAVRECIDLVLNNMSIYEQTVVSYLNKIS
ncbi:MAG: HAD hydrolase family protein [Candidatus Cloacimonetes bacterium]|nr:HAD hydrolase family protein [Candidatus Cloacimonadota bacterium]